MKKVKMIKFHILFIGSFIVKLLKAKDLFVPHYQSSLNHKSDDGPEDKGAYPNKLHSVESLLSFTEEDARKLLVGLPVRELESGQVLN